MKLDLNDVGCYVHTALRTACDSTPASLAYNLIHACDGEWGLFLTKVMKMVEEYSWSEGTSFTEKVECSFKELAEKGIMSDYWPSKHELQESNEPLFHSLCLAFKLCSAGDWQAIMYYIAEEEKDGR